MKSGTQIFEENMAREAGDAYLELLEAAKLALRTLNELTSDRFALGDDKPARDALGAAIARCESWHSRLPRKENP